jgi:hypothetical protein
MAKSRQYLLKTHAQQSSPRSVATDLPTWGGASRGQPEPVPKPTTNPPVPSAKQWVPEPGSLPWMHRYFVITTTIDANLYLVDQIDSDGTIFVKPLPGESEVLTIKNSQRITMNQVKDAVRPNVGDELVVIDGEWYYRGKAKEIRDGIVTVRIKGQGKETRTKTCPSKIVTYYLISSSSECLMYNFMRYRKYDTK